MRIKPLKIIFESFDDFINRADKDLRDVIKNKKKSLQSSEVLVWASVESYQQFMSDQKYSILATIHAYRPQSVYQLAKILGRAQQNVARDCDLLEAHGFIKCEQSKVGRRGKVPRLTFDYNAIFIYLPCVTYKVAFERAA